MQTVLISSTALLCHRILTGQRKAELRLTKPKVELPFKVLIYCSKAHNTSDLLYIPASTLGNTPVNGNVIGEFICNTIGEYYLDQNGQLVNYEQSGAPMAGVEKWIAAGYIKDKRKGYVWHIANLKIYETPLPLYKIGKGLTRAPQSWCYIK